jgi:hypothetical protein
VSTIVWTYGTTEEPVAPQALRRRTSALCEILFAYIRVHSRLLFVSIRGSAVSIRSVSATNSVQSLSMVSVEKEAKSPVPGGR